MAGGTTGWPIYEGYFPDDQDQMVGIFETGGLAQDTLGRENVRVTMQVRVRAAKLSYPVARDRWQRIWNVLQDAGDNGGASPNPLAGYALIQAVSAAPLVFNDDYARPNLTSNWRIVKKRE